MTKKYTVFLNRIPKEYKVFSEFEKARIYNAKHGINIEWTVKDVSVRGYESYWNSGSQRYLLKGSEVLVQLDKEADVNVFVFDQQEWGNPRGSKYPLKMDVPTGFCMVLGAQPFICVGAYREGGQSMARLLHEIMHSHTQSASLAGFTIQDVLDTYREDWNPDSPTGNFAEQWKLLQPYITAPSRNVVLQRLIDLYSQLLKLLQLKAKTNAYDIE